MNKKNTKKYIKRISNNNIVILSNDYTIIFFEDGGFPTFTENKPPKLGKEIIMEQFGRNKIIGTIKTLKRKKSIGITKIYKYWELMVTVKNRDKKIVQN